MLGGSLVAPAVPLAGLPLDGRRRRQTGVVSGGCWGGEHVGCPPLPVGLVPHSLPSPSQPGGQVWSVSGFGVLGLQGRGGACGQRLGGGGACTGETPGGPRLGGLGRRGGPGRARRTAPPPQRAGPRVRAPGGLVRPGAGPSGNAGPPRGRHGSSGRCPSPGFCTWGTMVLHAPNIATLSAPARSRRAAALRSRERNALGRRPRGPPGIRQEGRPPLEGAGVVVHEKTVTRWRPHAGRRSQAPDPRVPEVCRQAHKLQHHLVACCEKWTGRQASTRGLAGGGGSDTA